jgi:F1F0 ATPase subunit 2
MNDILILIFCGIAGGGLGTFFFIGLWWTVRKGVSAKNPAFLFLGSQLLRTITVVAGFYYLSNWQWPRLLCGLLGFLLSRELIKSAIQREVRHAA